MKHATSAAVDAFPAPVDGVAFGQGECKGELSILIQQMMNKNPGFKRTLEQLVNNNTQGEKDDKPSKKPRVEK